MASISCFLRRIQAKGKIIFIAKRGIHYVTKINANVLEIIHCDNLNHSYFVNKN